MGKEYSILVGTIGAGLWRSSDGGASFSKVRREMEGDSQVFTVAADPSENRVVYAGTGDGIFRSEDRGATFRRLDSELNEYAVWSIAVDPSDGGTVFAGTRPGALFRSRDGGERWEKLPVEMAETCPNVRIPRVTTVAVDPTDRRVVWAGVEVDGLRRSLDGGDTWSVVGATAERKAAEGEPGDPDIHGLAVSSGAPGTVLVNTPMEMFVSSDVGESWKGLNVKASFPMVYGRGLAVKADDPNVIFVGNGDGPSGMQGNVQRSKDRGQTWEAISMPVAPNSPIWCVAANAADPELLVCCSHFGQVFNSDNGGDTWEKLPREFSEIRGLAWLPN